MSIKTFRDHEHTLLIFLALSVLLHLGALGVVELLPKGLYERQRVLTTPIPVEIEAPPPALPERVPQKEEKVIKEPEETRRETTKPKEFIKEAPRPEESNISTEKKEAEHLSTKEQRVVRETVPLPAPP